ncbi:MAG: ectoine/hydroxyectoine ABC transporter permease subunit EhuC [Nitriliruptoraceae bacterium]|nr:ectoine/hydroxyectoine ABC transporter permease subunit EhuC [Nitriliruptoraceae bacterium]
MADLLLTPGQYRSLWVGTQTTIQLLLWSFVLGVLLSVVFGLMRLSERKVLRGIALVYVELFRGISSIVLLFWFVFALPILLDIDQPSRVLMAIVALGANMGGYGAEIVRGAVLSVPKGQHEATIALNMTARQRVRHIVLPQALPIILPPMGNLTIEILKGTALVSLVGLRDLTSSMQILRNARNQMDVPISVPVLFLNGLLIYFALSQVVALIFRLAERWSARTFEQRTGRRAVPIEGARR